MSFPISTKFFLIILLAPTLLISNQTLNAFQQPVNGALTEMKPNFVAGNDYKLIENNAFDVIDDLSQLQQVIDIEIFYWYGCDSCRKVEQELAEYLKDKPDLKVKRTPVVAYLSWRPQAYLQPIMEQLQILDPLLILPSNDEIYQACIENCDLFSSFEKAKLWLQKRLKLSQLPSMDETAIWQTEKDQQKQADSYSISQVPTIIVNETAAVDANMAKSSERLIEIVDFLLKQSSTP